MTTLENVEKLRARANVSYEEAKEALNATGGDLLDAMIYLENNGKVAAPPSGGSYSSSQNTSEQSPGTDYAKAEQKDESFGAIMGQLFRFLGRLLDKSLRNDFEVWRGSEKVFSVPVLLLIVLAIFAFYFTLPALIIALFFGFRYKFSGRDLDKTAVNKVMDSAANAAEAVKKEFNEEFDDEFKEDLREARDELREELREVERELDELNRYDKR
ncbi:MAG: ubiquitin [Oscillospiraceae bacterium]|nr:ubiquitin [Oscillospiraceae bacterium]